MPESNPLPKGTHRSRAIALYHQKRYDRMEAELRLELADDPEDAVTLVWLGMALWKLDRRAEALAVVGDAIRLQPDHSDAYYIRARIYWQTLDLAPAEEAILEALRLQPTAPEYLDFLADVRRVEGRYEEALELVERGLAIEPHHVNCLYNRGLILTRLGRLAEARESYLAALTQSPEQSELHRDLGRLLLQMNAVGPAVEHLREALRLDPNQEAELRPLITEGLKRHSPWYDGLVHIATTNWLLVLYLPLMVAVFWFGRDTLWPPLAFLNRGLPIGIGYVLILLSGISMIDPLYHFALSRSEFGRLMLTDSQRRQAKAVVVCLVGAAVAAVWFVATGKFTPTILMLFCVFWIAPVAEAFTLYPPALRLVGIGCTVGSVLFLAVHLCWRWFAPDVPEFWDAWLPTLNLLLGVGLFLLFVPFVLSRSSDDVVAWRPWPRRRAVMIFWAILLVSWAVLIFGHYGSAFAPRLMVYPLQNLFSLAALPLGAALYFEIPLVEWLAKR